MDSDNIGAVLASRRDESGEQTLRIVLPGDAKTEVFAVGRGPCLDEADTRLEIVEVIQALPGAEVELLGRPARIVDDHSTGRVA